MPVGAGLVCLVRRFGGGPPEWGTATYHVQVSFPSVVAVTPGSPADQADVRVGDEIQAINGVTPRDVLEYRMLVDSSPLELDVVRAGIERSVTIEKDPGEPIGIEVHSAVFDRVVTCDNHCPFCFIYQLPKGMRKSLYLKDDDYRLSFLYGNFTTLTRCTERDIERIVDENLSPLYVSIHATDPEVRSELLRNRRGAVSLRWLRVLLDAGIEIHGQVVVCPDINGGAVLGDTLLGILDRFPEIRSVGIVPLGVSDHNREPTMRPHTPEEAAAAIDIVETWAAHAEEVVGRKMFFASDEWYLIAGRPLPSHDYYGPFEQHENGVGMIRSFEREVHQAIAHPSPSGVPSETSASDVSDVTTTEAPAATANNGATGFFQWVDGAPGEGYRSPRIELTDTHDELVGTDVVLITGEYGAQALGVVLSDLQSVCQAEVSILPVKNRYFGGNTAVTGLVTGADLGEALTQHSAAQHCGGQVPGTDTLYVLPDVMLSRGVFLDGVSVNELPEAVRVVGTDGQSLVSTLRSVRVPVATPNNSPGETQ